MAQDPYQYFRLEAHDLHEQLATGILELEKKGSTPATVQRLLRLAHTLKGASRVVKQREIADRAHAIEDAISPFREITSALPPGLVETLLSHLDDIGGQILSLTQGGAAPVAAPSAPMPDEGLRTVRTDVAEMDALLEGVAETHALLSGLRAAGETVTQARHLTDLLLEQVTPRGRVAGGGRTLADFKQASEMAEELRRRLGGLERSLGPSAEQMDRELNQLRDAAEQLRLVSAGTLFAALERTARDAAQAVGKTLTFAGKGGGIRLDAYVLSAVQQALVQIVRNAVAHGIESASERRAAGKPPAGQVSVEVVRRGRQIVFQCRDDGRGLDLNAVRQVAIGRGLLAADRANLTAADLVGLLLRGGISTSDSVTEVSGRGVGLDVVREAVEQLGGNVTVHTESGQGTSFELTVPFSLASMEVLVVEASDNAVAIPLDAVRTAMRISSGDISWSPAGASILFGQAAIPFVSLSRLLYGVRHGSDRAWSAIVVSGGGVLAALGIDRLLDTARTIVRPLPDHMPVSAMVAGASLDSDGNPRLVLDPDGLVSAARRDGASTLEPAASQPLVLVIDDSLTTRMLEQSILVSAGYEVDVATSGEEGLETARKKPYALILVDVEMPGIDGFTFVERIRADPALHDIPAILVTSRSAPEDLQRGRDVGAQGYIVKSEFDQNHLLRMIRPLVLNR